MSEEGTEKRECKSWIDKWLEKLHPVHTRSELIGSATDETSGYVLAKLWGSKVTVNEQLDSVGGDYLACLRGMNLGFARSHSLIM